MYLAQVTEAAQVVKHASKLTDEGPLGIVLFVAMFAMAGLVYYVLRSHDRQIDKLLAAQQKQQDVFDKHIENLRADGKEQRELDRRALQELTTKLVEALDSK